MDPSPWPLLADVMTTHAAPLDAVQVQSRPEATASVPAPPAAGEVSTEFLRLMLHRKPDGPVVDCCVDVQDAVEMTTSASSRAVMRRREPDLVRFERSGSLLMRYVCAAIVLPTRSGRGSADFAPLRFQSTAERRRLRQST